jgi:uroporphyrinogen-III decarboxylase
MSEKQAEQMQGRSGEQLLAERSKRIWDAAALKKPDRIPISMTAGYLLAKYGGISNQELQDDHEQAQEILERFACEFQPDSIMGPPTPGASPILGDRMTAWPGHGLPASGSFQFVEHEFMKAEDYEAFLRDPSDWAVRTYLPRAFSRLEGLRTLPPLGMWVFGCYNLESLGFYAAPPVRAAAKAFAQAIRVAIDEGERMQDSLRRLAALGFPPPFFVGPHAAAPFDFMSDTLRGMRGIMLDMLSRPELLLAAEEKVIDIMLEHVLICAKASGAKVAGFPLHRGSDGFMSLAQFERFYWPQLKRMFLVLIDNGITPHAFFEGAWDQRLEYLRELPAGKVMGWFQKSDIFRVKEVLGDTMCIIGGMPNSLLAGGTVSEVRERTHELCEVVGKNGGYIMSTGVGELEGSNLELVHAWVDATREFGVY